MSAARRKALLVLLKSAIGLFLVTGLFASAHSVGPDFDRFFNELGVVMLLIEPESGQIVDANPAAARLYGYSQEALRGMTIQQINTLTPDQVAAERKLAGLEGRNYFIFRHRLAGSEIRTVEVHSRPFDFDGRQLLLSIINDITPGRHQAQDLWHYQQRLEEMVDAQVSEIERVRERQIWWLLAGLLVQMALIVWLITNIARRRRLEREREALLTTLQGRNAELNRLGEVMTHHFQEPTRRLVSYAQRLQAKSALATDADSRQALGFIDEQARRLSSLVKEAQAYLALDHMMPRAGARTDSGEALRAAIEAADPAAHDAQLVVHGPLPPVPLPERSLRELFSILLVNALTYRHPERRLRIDVRAHTNGKRTVFRISDNGTGIAPEYREQVFGLYTRLVPNSVPGTGMGLARARKIVEMAGGRIYIEDGIDDGICVTIELPTGLTA